MKIYVHKKILMHFSCLHYYFFSCPDGWMFCLTGIEIESIQIVSLRVESVVTTRHSIRIQHRNNLEDKMFAQTSSLLVFQTKAKVSMRLGQNLK